jgi:hypothetical protein
MSQAYSTPIKDLLATLVSLRVFSLCGFGHRSQYIHTENYLPYITEVTDRAPHLEFFSIFEGGFHHYVKRVCGKWVICDEAEFPSCKL